jgi:putative ABC transport system permease protein
VARDLPWWLRLAFRAATPAASEEALGDIAEEYSRGATPLWVCRQPLSAVGRGSPRRTSHRHAGAFLSQTAEDLRLAVRALGRHPGFALAAIVPIALGVGVNTAGFSIFDSIALQPVQSPGADQLVTVYQDFQGVKKRRVHGARRMFSVPEYRTLRDGTRSLSGLAAFTRYWTVTLGGDSPREINGELVSCNYFDVLRISPALGPGFTAANCDAPDAAPAVVLSHSLWTAAFASDRAIVGRTIALNGRPVTVAGVAPEGFGGIDIAQVSFFAPLSMQEVLRPKEHFYLDPDTSWLTLVGRRNAGTTIAQVRAELALIQGGIDRQQPGRTTTLLIEPARTLSMPQARHDVFQLAAIVGAAFGLVLLIACANVANLLLARGAARQKEIAVRMSLGISRARLIRQLMTESLLIASVGTIGGSLLARWSFRGLLALLVSLAPGQVPVLRLDGGLNLHVIAFAIAITGVTSLAFGLVPALQASRLDIQTLLNRDTAGAGRRAAGWLRGSLIGVQAAVCTVLMISAALLLRAAYVTQTLDPGFAYRDVTVVSFDTRGMGYEPQQALTFRRALIDRLHGLPGVASLAEAGKTPLSAGDMQTQVRTTAADAWQEIDFNIVSPEYFAVVRVPIVRGRTFTASDSAEPTRTVIVTEATARRFWPGQDPIGRTLRMGLGPDRDVPLEVVGVAADAQVARIADTTTPYMYLPPDPQSADGLHLLVRSAVDRAALAGSVRAIARDLAPGLVVSVVPLEQNLDFWRGLARVVGGMSGSLSLLALVLAAVGIYGVVAFVVSRRMREMGIRMILGAALGDVRRLILRQTLRPVVAGLIAGMAGAAAVSRVLESVLYGVSPLDPVSFVTAPLLLLIIAIAAGLAPTRRLLAIDPAAVLRRD